MNSNRVFVFNQKVFENLPIFFVLWENSKFTHMVQIMRVILYANTWNNEKSVSWVNRTIRFVSDSLFESTFLPSVEEMGWLKLFCLCLTFYCNQGRCFISSSISTYTKRPTIQMVLSSGTKHLNTNYNKPITSKEIFAHD